MTEFVPKIILFCCNWGACTGADVTDTSNNHNHRIIRTMCSGRVEPTFILQAFDQGADGVMITGCHPGDCHYNSGNYKTKRRIILLKNMLQQLGVESDRLRLEWLSTSEASKFQSAVNGFTDKITELGPLTLNRKLKIGS